MKIVWVSADPPARAQREAMHWKLYKLPYKQCRAVAPQPLEVEKRESLEAQRQAVIDALNLKEKLNLQSVAEFDAVAEIRDFRRQNAISLCDSSLKWLQRERTVYYYINGRISTEEYHRGIRSQREKEEEESHDQQLRDYLDKVADIYDPQRRFPANVMRVIARRNMSVGKLPQDALLLPDEATMLVQLYSPSRSWHLQAVPGGGDTAWITIPVPGDSIPELLAEGERLRRRGSGRVHLPSTWEPVTMRLPGAPASPAAPTQAPEAGPRQPPSPGSSRSRSPLPASGAPGDSPLPGRPALDGDLAMASLEATRALREEYKLRMDKIEAHLAELSHGILLLMTQLASAPGTLSAAPPAPRPPPTPTGGAARDTGHAPTPPGA